MSLYDFECRKLTIDDLKLDPEVFNNEQDGKAFVGKAAHYAQFIVDGIKNPVYYFRNIEPHKQRWAGISEWGDGPLDVQKGLHQYDLAQEEAATIRYQKTNDSPITFEIVSKNPYSLLRFIDDGSGGVLGEFKEGENGSILDIKVETFPVAVFSHSNLKQPAPYFQVNTLFTGTYLGKKIKGLGGFDRTYIVDRVKGDETETDKLYAATYQVICALYSGVRKDGRKECVYALISDENGKGVGMYYIDGEDPIVTDDVHLDAEFRRLPYVYDNTVVYTDAIWKIGPKTINFVGRWGTKGFTAYPKIEKHGQSQCFGTWYEGEVPYEHVISHAFNENSGDAYADRIEKLGFKIVD